MTALSRPYALLESGLRDRADAVRLRCGADAVTGAELLERATALASGLARRLGTGQRVGLLLGNRSDYLVADVALARAGLVKVPINPVLSVVDIAHIVSHSGALLLLADRQTLADLDGDGWLRERLLADGVEVVETGTAPWQDLLSGPTVDARPVAADAPAVLYYTGGTTGRPKGVVHTQASVAVNLVAHLLEAEIGRDEVMVLSTALTHSAGVFAAAGLARGATVVVLDRFTPDRLCEALLQHGGRWTMVVPTMLYRLLDHLAESGAAPPPLDTLVYGSAPIAPNRLRQAIETFGPVLVQLYGQTECPNWGTALTKADHAAALGRPELLQSAGRRCALTGVRIVADDGTVPPMGQVGEVCLTGPYVMAGYHADPESTRATLVDGWVRTRDLGYLDDEGYLFLKDRAADLIITGGYNVYSSDVEAIVAAVPGVRQVAVIGIPDGDWGEAVCALVVAEPGTTLTKHGLRAACRDRLGAYKTPKVVQFVPEIPTTPFGKPDKKALRAPFWASRERSIA